MQFSLALRIGVLSAALCLCAHGQDAQIKDAPVAAKGLPPRAAPADYQAHAQAGEVTIAAEFTGHSVPTAQGALSTEEYVVIEAGVFGPAGSRAKLSFEDFSLRINSKKTPLPAQPYGVILESLKDPEWEPPEVVAKRSKTSMSGGDEGSEKPDPKAPPAPVKIPVPVQRAMAQRVQKASLPEGDRALPQAGLLFFEYRGKTKSIRSIELIYSGPAGNATVTIQQ
jgi:hypothetical protein